MNAHWNKVRKLMQAKGIKITGSIPPALKVVVPVSGGKDSQVCAEKAKDMFHKDEILFLFNDTKYEHPITYAHVDKITDGFHTIKTNSGSVLSYCEKYKRFPGGTARHCTEYLKIRPSKFLYKFLSSELGHGFDVWLGVRQQESHDRANRYSGLNTEDKYMPHEIMGSKYPQYLGNNGVRFVLPVIDWSKDDIFNELGDRINPLYKTGKFDRVGCFPCLAGGDKSKATAFKHDATGELHYRIAKRIAKKAGRPVMKTKIGNKMMRADHKEEVGSFCGDLFSGCSFCSM